MDCQNHEPKNRQSANKRSQNDVGLSSNASLNSCPTLKICHLYPREMNIYGDHGNLLVLKKRCQRRDIVVEIHNYHPGAVFPGDADIILGGGGQDSGQLAVQADLPRIAAPLRKMAAAGIPMLVICGMYQLFGSYFKTIGGEIIEGLSVLDLYTEAGDDRMIGNIVTHSDVFGEIIGYENHSGRTWLGKNAQAANEQVLEAQALQAQKSQMLDSDCQESKARLELVTEADEPGFATFPLAQVSKGSGNNDQDKTEGARAGNVIGTYLHGPLLPKNPKLADFLIQKALEHNYGKEAAQEIISRHPLDDTLSEQARAFALRRPR